MLVLVSSYTRPNQSGSSTSQWIEAQNLIPHLQYLMSPDNGFWRFIDVRGENKRSMMQFARHESDGNYWKMIYISLEMVASMRVES